MGTSAGAAAIPPTPECAQLSKTLYLELAYESHGGVNAKREKRLERRMYAALAEAGCLSSATPVVDDQARPFMPRCFAAAASARAFWDPTRRTFMTMVRNYVKNFARPHARRMKQLRARIARLKERGGRQGEIRKLVRTRKGLDERFERRVRPINRKAFRFIGRQSFETALVVTELAALKCVDSDAILRNTKQPAARVINQNLGPIFASAVHILVTANRYAEEKQRGAPDRGFVSNASTYRALLDLHPFYTQSEPGVPSMFDRILIGYGFFGWDGNLPNVAPKLMRS